MTNAKKTLAKILSLATVSLPYQAMASNSNIETVVQTQVKKKVTGTVVHVDEESVSCYSGGFSGITALSDFKYEILRVATSEGDTLKFVVPQSTEYKIGDNFREYVLFSDSKRFDLDVLIRDNSDFSGAIQATYLKADGIINRRSQFF